MFDFIHITFIDILDIVLVGLLIFEIIRFFRKTSVMGVFLGILAIYVTWLIVRALNMKLLSFLLGQILGVGVIALIILFQPEIRRFLFGLGSRIKSAPRRSFFARLIAPKQAGMDPQALEELTGAVRKMSETKTGALIVLRHGSSLERYIETGDTLNASINRRLIENIFFKNTPLHDGAMILSADSILAARCTLPISENPKIPPQFGMRHKAAIGISEQTDASVIVVSEETGDISFVERGELQHAIGLTTLRLAIENSYK
ncbi:MAG: diadenylate cyclase CdaA [Bacteroidales bacterium]|nr:diadenylate cyclase CdaA [Bacteroidales bacterium]